MSRRPITAALSPWAGLVAGIVSAGIVHQFGSDGTFNDCRAVGPVPLLIVASIGLLLCAAGGVASWRSMGRGNGARRVIAVISAGSAALLAFAIILPMIASILLPPCFQ